MINTVARRPNAQHFTRLFTRYQGRGWLVGGKVVNLNQVIISTVARRPNTQDVTRQLGTEHLIHFQPIFTRA